MGKVILVSYAGAADPPINARLLAAQQSLVASAAAAGVDRVISWQRPALTATSFYQQHREILDRKRGGGFWLWKPYIILQALKSASDDDVIVYWDVGRVRPNILTRSVKPLVGWCRDHNGIFPGVPTFPHGRWTKRDCFHLMGCDSDEFWNARQIQATFSLWSGRAAVEFVSQWMQWCCDRRCLTDDPNECGLPNLPGFREHRHDQSVLTNLCIKQKLPVPYSPSIPGGMWSKNMNLWSDLVDARSSESALSEEQTCRIILTHAPNQPFANRRLGLILLDAGHRHEGLELLRKAAETAPNLPSVQRDLASALERCEQPQDAIEVLRRVSLLPALEDVASLFVQIGNLAEKMQKAAHAEVAYRQALIADPECVAAWLHLANLLTKQGRRDEAIDALGSAGRLQTAASEPMSPAPESIWGS